MMKDHIRVAHDKSVHRFKNVEFEPIKLKENTGDETLPPDPLHTCLLGHMNKVLSKMEVIYKEDMKLFIELIVSTKRERRQGVSLMAHL